MGGSKNEQDLAKAAADAYKQLYHRLTVNLDERDETAVLAALHRTVVEGFRLGYKAAMFDIETSLRRQGQLLFVEVETNIIEHDEWAERYGEGADDD
jgi:hypothetical protein